MDGAQFEISVVHCAPAMAATPLPASPCCLCQQTAGRHMVPERTPNIHLLAEIHLLFLSRVQPAQRGSLSNRVKGSWCYRFGFLRVSGYFLTCKEVPLGFTSALSLSLSGIICHNLSLPCGYQKNK